MICGGLDIGGTKIEARLFGPGMEPGDSRRVATPRADAGAFFAALAAQVAWLRAQGGFALPIGIAMSGVVQPGNGPDSGIVRAANLPISGEHMDSRLRQIAGRALPVMNDAMALAFSEANGGAGSATGASVGLVLGTGLAAGLCIDARPAPRRDGHSAAPSGAGPSRRGNRSRRPTGPRPRSWRASPRRTAPRPAWRRWRSCPRFRRTPPPANR